MPAVTWERWRDMTDGPTHQGAADWVEEPEEDEECGVSEASWIQLRGEPTKASLFTTAELLCGGESEDEEANLYVKIPLGCYSPLKEKTNMKERSNTKGSAKQGTGLATE